MACSNCGYNPCTCQTPIYQYNWLNIDNYPCNPCSSAVVCKIKVPGQCVFYNGPALTCIGLGTNVNYDLIIATLSQAICNLQNCCEQQCIAISIPEVQLPNAMVGVPYVYQLLVGGTPIFTLNNVVKPAWMTIQIAGNVLTFSGVPTITGQTIITFNISNNCSNNNLVYPLTVQQTSSCIDIINVDVTIESND